MATLVKSNVAGWADWLSQSGWERTAQQQDELQQ